MTFYSFFTRIRRAPFQTTLLFGVLVIHLLFVYILFVSPQFAVRKKTHKPLIVKTIVPKVSVPAPVLQKKIPPSPASAAVAAKPQPVQKTAPLPKKEPAIADRALSKNKPVAAKKNPVPQQRAAISDSLAKQLEESIAKMTTPKNNPQTVAKKMPTQISLQIDNPINEKIQGRQEANDYIATLASQLHRQLNLPDYGEVKIQLRLRQDGTVIKLVVLKTESEKNRQYLESNLQQLKFPRFEGAYAKEKEYTFILTFCNE